MAGFAAARVDARAPFTGLLGVFGFSRVRWWPGCAANVGMAKSRRSEKPRGTGLEKFIAPVPGSPAVNGWPITAVAGSPVNGAGQSPRSAVGQPRRHGRRAKTRPSRKTQSFRRPPAHHPAIDLRLPTSLDFPRPLDLRLPPSDRRLPPFALRSPPAPIPPPGDLTVPPRTARLWPFIFSFGDSALRGFAVSTVGFGRTRRCCRFLHHPFFIGGGVCPHGPQSEGLPSWNCWW